MESPHLVLEIPAHHRYLNIVSAALAALLEREEGIEAQDALSYNVQLAVQEVCTNVVDHAYRGQGGRIKVQAFIYPTPHRLWVEICDTGESLDISLVEAPDPEALQVRGFGIFLIDQLMDEAVYAPTTAGNCWQLEKQF